jgi:hypothetical protein
MITISVAKDFSKTPGFRYRGQSPTTSGQQFREEILEPKYLEAVSKKEKLQVILDGTDGYLTSFLEESFGGLQRNHLKSNVLDSIEIISNEERHWIEDIQRYVKEVLEKSK